MADRGPVIRVEDNNETRTVDDRRLHYDEPPPWQDPTQNNPTVVDDNSIVKRPIRRDMKGRTLVLNANGQIVPILYGKDQAGAKVPWGEAHGPYLYMMFVVGEGPLEAIEDIGFGDAIETSFARLGLVAGTDYNVHLGDPAQAVDSIFSAIDSGWIWVFPRLAYVTVKLNINTPNMDQIDVGRFRCNVKGRQVVDSRIDPTLADASRAYSDNPALCELDFLTSRLFGMGAKLSEVNIDSSNEAADDCDVVTASGLTAPTGTPTDTVNSGTGTIEAGIYRHAYTFVDTNKVESLLSPPSTEVTVISGLSQHITVSGLDAPGGGVFRNLYRQKKNPDGTTWGPWKRCEILEDDSSTTFNDFLPTRLLGGSPPDETDIRQFRLSMVVDQAGETCAQTIDTMRQCFASQLAFNNGKFQAFVDKVRDPTTIVFGDHNIVDLPTIEGRDPSQIPAQVVVNFTDAANSFAPRQAFYPAAPVIGEGDSRSDRNILSFDLPWIPTFDQAMRIAIWIWKRLNRSISLSWRTLQVGALPIPGSIVTLTHARAGIPETQVIVTSCAPTADRVYWDLTGEIYDPDDYDLDYHSEDDGAPPTHEPPDPPDPPTNLVLTNVPRTGGNGLPTVDVKIEWDSAEMPYETSTLVRFSTDGFSTFTELGPFVTGPVFLYNPTLGIQYDFKLYTVRVSNGQLSADSLDGSIVPSFTDTSIPEVTQIQIGPNNGLTFYGPTPEYFITTSNESMPPIPAPTLAAAAGGLVDDGDHLVGSTRVFSWGETKLGATALVTLGGGNNRINITNLDPSPPAGTLFKKVYVTKVGPGADFFHASDDAPAGTSDSLIHADSSYVTNDLLPEECHGLVGWEIFDAFGVGDPTTDPMPLFKFLPWNKGPQRYAALDLSPIVHEDPTDHAPRIDVYIRVVVVEEGGGAANSTGVLFSKHPATWPPTGPPSSIPVHVTVVDGINEDLDIPIDANFVYLDDGGLTADFILGGLTVAGSTPTTRKRIVLVNNTPFRANLGHESAGSTAANRFAVPGANFYDFGPVLGSTTIEYGVDESDRWTPIAINNAGQGPVTDTDGGGGTFIRNSLTEQPESDISISGLAHARQFAGNVDFSGSVVEGGTYDDLVLDVWADVVHLPACTITGIIPPDQGLAVDGVTPNKFGVIVTLVNASATGVGNGIEFKHNDAGSAAANRLAGIDDLDMATGAVFRQAFTIQYDYTNSFWIVVRRNF
ncbi:MAG TPA: phage tail protein [Thermoanaerobaculia bacterium]|nr:phage tail protein [Thermoanaerobaculia bacterium]